MKSGKVAFVVVLLVALVSACISTKSIASLNDRDYFQESPTIVTNQESYYLRFVYPEKSFAFFMQCESKVKGDSLIYYLPVTTSSGNLRGQTQFQEILEENELRIVKLGNVFWEEPDGSLVSMEFSEISSDEIELLP